MFCLLSHFLFDVREKVKYLMHQTEQKKKKKKKKKYFYHSIFYRYVHLLCVLNIFFYVAL